MGQTYDLPLLAPRDFVVASLGPSTQDSISEYVPFRVAKTKLLSLAYNFQNNYPSWLPLSPVTVSAISGLSQSFLVQNLQLQISQISNVQNLFTIQNTFEAYQVFIGVAPSPLRVFTQQPLGTPGTSMDQNINLTTGYYDAGWYDGYMSPYNSPTEVSELLVLDGLEPGFSLLNPVATVSAPEFNLVLNRMELQPVSNKAFATSVVMGKVPRTRFISINNPLQLASGFNKTRYPGVITVRVPATE
jgi:hypothetical protein